MVLSLRKNVIELWRFRELLWELSSAYLKLRHAGSVLGFLWTLLNPIFYIATYWLVFSFVIKMGMPNYPMFLIPGYLAWNFTFGGILGASESIIHGKHLITKIAFPTEILTLASVLVAFIDFILSVIIFGLGLLIADLLFSFNFTINAGLLLYLPVIIFFHFFFTSGVSLLAAAASVFFKDLPKLINVFGNLFFFMTPIFYPIEYIPEKFQFIALANPVAVIVRAYQNIIYYGRVDLQHLFLLAVSSAVIFLAGFFIFNRTKHSFAEIS